MNDLDRSQRLSRISTEWTMLLQAHSGTADADPMFHDPGDGDYRLRPGSQAIDRSASLDTACFRGGR